MPWISEINPCWDHCSEQNGNKKPWKSLVFANLSVILWGKCRTTYQHDPIITYCIVSKKYTLNTYLLFSLKKHTLFLDFCCFWHPKHGPRGTCLSVKNDPFSVFLYSSMISTFEYKWPPRGPRQGFFLTKSGGHRVFLRNFNPGWPRLTPSWL